MINPPALPEPRESMCTTLYSKCLSRAARYNPPTHPQSLSLIQTKSKHIHTYTPIHLSYIQTKMGAGKNHQLIGPSLKGEKMK